jgi:hypothetical protein
VDAARGEGVARHGGEDAAGVARRAHGDEECIQREHDEGDEQPR